MKTRIKAALLHLLSSALFIGFFVGGLILYFYPSIYLDAENPYQALKILIPADICLGPLLTLVIYKKGKWGLKFDLTVIIICQLIALGYGSWALYSSRPGFMVFHGDGYYVVPPRIDQTPIKNTPLEVGPFDRPKMVNLFLPGNAKNRFKLAMESMSSGIPLLWQAQYFQAYDKVSTEDLAKASIDIKTLKQKSDKRNLALLEKLSHSQAKYAYIPIIGIRKATILVVNLSTKQPEYALDIFPY